MTEGNLVSKRTTRAFVEDHHIVESCSVGQPKYESRRHSCGKEKDIEGKWSSASSVNQSEAPPDMEMESDGIGMASYGVDDLGKEVSKKLSLSPPKSDDEDKKDDEKQYFNFGEVITGNVYRSSFPRTEDYQFLQSLGLKTIVSLVNKDFPDEFKAFMKANDICHKIIDMPGTKKTPISEAVMNSIMEVVLDKQYYPLLIHCNHGKHRTGCTVAVIRHAHGVAITEIEKEYRTFAGEKVRDCDVKYINEYQISSLHRFYVTKAEKIQEHRLRRRSTKMTRCIVIAAVSLSIWLVSLYFSPAYHSMWSQV